MLYSQVQFINPLTPKIQARYADLNLLDTENSKTLGYLTYEAKLRTTGEIHHIRVFNHDSSFAERDLNLTTTLFLQETLRLCSLYPHGILLDTFEFHEGKICYALKPVVSRVPDAPKLNPSKLLKNILTDLNYLTPEFERGSGNFFVDKSRFYQIQPCCDDSESRDSSQENSSPSYFMKDWIQVVWTSMLAEENVEMNRSQSLSDSTVSLRNNTEKESVYDFALNFLELYGINSQDVKTMLKAPSLYDIVLQRILFENPLLDSQIFPLDVRKTLTWMLAKNTLDRPRITEIIQHIKHEEKKKKEELKYQCTPEKLKERVYKELKVDVKQGKVVSEFTPSTQTTNSPTERTSKGSNFTSPFSSHKSNKSFSSGLSLKSNETKTETPLVSLETSIVQGVEENKFSEVTHRKRLLFSPAKKELTKEDSNVLPKIMLYNNKETAIYSPSGKSGNVHKADPLEPERKKMFQIPQSELIGEIALRVRGKDSYFKIWDSELKLVAEFPEKSGISFKDHALLPDGQKVVILWKDKLQIYDLCTKSIIYQEKMAASNITLNHNGSALAICKESDISIFSLNFGLNQPLFKRINKILASSPNQKFICVRAAKHKTDLLAYLTRNEATNTVAVSVKDIKRDKVKTIYEIQSSKNPLIRWASSSTNSDLIAVSSLETSIISVYDGITGDNLIKSIPYQGDLYGIIWSNTGLLGICTSEDLHLYKIQKDQYEAEKGLSNKLKKFIEEYKISGSYYVEFLDKDL